MYVNSFDPPYRSLEEPILALRALGDFIASILKEGDEIAPPGSQPAETTVQDPSPSNSPSHLAKTLNSAEEASDRGSVETKRLPNSSPYFNTILNTEPAMQASTSGHADTEIAATSRNQGSSAYADLMQAAGLVSDTNLKSPSPRHQPKRESPIDLEDTGSPSYSPPASPFLSLETILNQTEPLPNTPSSILSKPTPHYNPNPASARPPPRTPAWKIDLNARKGHPIHTLHVGPAELSILSRCLKLVHQATRKGEKCARVIAQRQQLASEMQAELEQWEVFCREVENHVRIEENAIEQTDGRKNGFLASDHARDYGHIDLSDWSREWGYGKIEAPSASRTRLDIVDEGSNGDETDLKARNNTNTGPTKPFRLRSPSAASSSSSSSSTSTDNKSTGTNTQAVARTDDAEEGDEMDVDLDDLEEGEIKDEDMDDDDDKKETEKRGFKSSSGGGGMLGLYGERI